MENKIIAPAILGTNKLKLKLRDSSQFMFSHMNMFGDDFKQVQTGQGFGFATQCNKSIEVHPCSLTIKAAQKHVYLYFKCPTSGGKATLLNSDSELFDTVDYQLVLLKSSTYKELQF